MFRVTRLPPKRWKEFRRLRLEALRRDPAAFGSSYAEEVRYPESTWRERMGNCLFALEGDVPVGMISLVFRERLKMKHVADIYGFYVDRAHRGRGAGTSLVASAISLARRNRTTKKVVLSVNPRFKAALSVYKSAGFVETGKSYGEILARGKYHDLINMELNFK
jgi:RimJ/RimL family protein N-acetyltransferase